MKKILLVVALVASAIGVGARAASATVCTLPNTLANGTVVDANVLNGNFTSLQSCGNNIDSNNIGANGIFATQLKPLTSAQAIFGGTVAYSFANGLGVTGTLNAQGITATSLTATGLTTAGVVLNSAAGVLSSSAGPLPTALGGTGSATQNFVDLTTAQTVGGVKTFSSGATIGPISNTPLTGAQANVFNVTGIAPEGSLTVGYYLQTDGTSMQFNKPGTGVTASISANGTYNVGSSSYGPTSANVNGLMTLTSALQIGVQSSCTTAGVAGTVMGIGPQSNGCQMTFNTTGSLGIAGSYFSASERRLKNHIAPFSDADLLRDLRATRIVRYAYRTEHAKHPTHIGFIADDTPRDLSGPRHKAYDVNAVSATALAGVQYLLHLVDTLKARVRALEARR